MIDLSPEQEVAFARFAAWYESRSWEDGEPPFYCQGGYAGTGKTRSAAEFVRRLGLDGVLYCAFTGKAALVLRQKGCEDACTIHSLLYQVNGDPAGGEVGDEMASLLKDREAKLVTLREWESTLLPKQPGVDFARIGETLRHPLRIEVDQIDERIEALKAKVRDKGPSFRRNDASRIAFAPLVVVDEASMVDDRMADDLLHFRVPILALLDPAQLPPVRGKDGTGFFSRREPDHLLTHIHRQEAGSGILALATRVRGGSRIDFRDAAPDVAIVERSNKPAVRDAVMAADQVLVGRNATRHLVNRRAREERGITDPMPVPGDRLVCLRNEHELGLLNGSMWECVSRLGDGMQHGKLSDQLVLTIRSLDEPGRPRMEVVCHPEHFLGRGDDIAFWSRLDAREFAFGYALTVHKAQGSQWDRVVLFDESRQFGKDEFRHSYTAVTRAARHLTVIV